MLVPILMALGFLLLGAEKFVAIPPQVTGVILVILGLALLIPLLG